MARIELQNIKKQFGEITVIKNINLSIEDGEFFTFVGPSGCGKSTILNMIAGLENVSDGNILFDGVAVNDLTPKERDVAMVFQSYALYPHMTVYNNIAFPLRMRKYKRYQMDEEVRRVASLLGLTELLARKPKELSGGQRQRVALGRALVRKPKVFLLDEPLSNLDARLRLEMRAELKRLHGEMKITTVYVTHDQAEALSLSDRMAVLDEGRIQQCGSPYEVYSKPANLFVAGFIGSPVMNFIPASVRKQEGIEVDCNGILIKPRTERKPLNDSVVVGVRPEDVSVSKEETKGDIRVTISLVEPAGSFNWVVFVWNDLSLRGVASIEEGFQAGDHGFIRFPAHRVVLFDKNTGERL